MYTSSPGWHHQTWETSKFRRKLKNDAHRILLIQALQALKEIPDDCEKETIFETKNSHRLQDHILKLFSPQVNNQTESDFIINTLTLCILNHKSFAGNYPWTKHYWCWKNKKPKTLKSSLKLILMIPLKCYFPRTSFSWALTVISAIIKVFHTNLQRNAPHWELKLNVISSQKMIHCRSIMFLLIIILLTLQLFYLKVPLHYQQIFLMVQFVSLDDFSSYLPFFTEAALQKILLPNISQISPGKKKWFQKQICLHSFLTNFLATEIS